MYFRIVASLHARGDDIKFITCDIITGAFDKMINSSIILSTCRKCRLLNMIFRKKEVTTISPFMSRPNLPLEILQNRSPRWKRRTIRAHSDPLSNPIVRPSVLLPLRNSLGKAVWSRNRSADEETRSSAHSAHGSITKAE